MELCAWNWNAERGMEHDTKFPLLSVVFEEKDRRGHC